MTREELIEKLIKKIAEAKKKEELRRIDEFFGTEMVSVHKAAVALIKELNNDDIENEKVFLLIAPLIRMVAENRNMDVMELIKDVTALLLAQN